MSELKVSQDTYNKIVARIRGACMVLNSNFRHGDVVQIDTDRQLLINYSKSEMVRIHGDDEESLIRSAIQFIRLRVASTDTNNHFVAWHLTQLTYTSHGLTLTCLVKTANRKMDAVPTDRSESNAR